MTPRLTPACLFLGLTAAALLPLQAGGPQASRDDRGRPWERHTIDDASRGADGDRILDVNGDGLPDVATGWEEGGQVRVCLHPGYAKVREKWPAVLVGKVGSPEDAVFADLDEDGAADVVSCCEGKTNQVFVHWAPRDRPRYLDPSAWETAAFPAAANLCQWMFSEPLQLDGRHGIDLIIGGKNKGGQIGWLQAPADPRDLAAWRYHHLRPAGWVMSLVAADMDHDGDRDVLVSDRRGKDSGCLWLENPGAGADQTRPWATHRIGPTGEEVMFLELADLDGDGLTDVLVPTFDRKLFFHRRTRATPPAWETHRLHFPDRTGSGKAVRVADVNQDGKRDIILCCADAARGSGLVWMTYPDPTDPSRLPEVHDISGLAGIKFDLIQLADLDGDGDLDVMNTEERANGRGLGVVWYENPTR